MTDAAVAPTTAPSSPADVDPLALINELEAGVAADEAEQAKDAPPEAAAKDETAPEEPEAAQAAETPKASRLIRWQDKLRKDSQKMRSERQSLERERASFTAERAELAELRAWKAKAKADPLAFVSEAGVDYEDVTQRRLRAGTPSEEIAALKRELEELKTGTASREKAAAEQREEQRQAQLAAQAEREFFAHVDGDMSRFPSINAFKGTVDVIRDAFKVAQHLHQVHGRVSNEQIAVALESEYAKLLSKVTRPASGNATSENASSAQETEPGKQAKPGAPRAQSTLKGSHAGERSGTRKLSEEEEREDIIATLEGRGTSAG